MHPIWRALWDGRVEWQATAERCPLHRDSAEILRFAAETCLLMSTTNRFISPSHGETVNGNTLSESSSRMGSFLSDMLSGNLSTQTGTPTESTMTLPC